MLRHFLLQVIVGFPQIHRTFEKNLSLTVFSSPPQALVAGVHSFHEKIVALEGEASQLEKAGNDASKATIGRSMTTVWQRWARLRAVAQDQEKILEDAVDAWKNLGKKVISLVDGLRMGSSLMIVYFEKQCFAFVFHWLYESTKHFPHISISMA